MTLADNLQRIRKSRDLSQLELAKAANVSQQLVSRLERGIDLTTKKLPDLARALGVSVTDLDEKFALSEPVVRPELLVPLVSWVSAGALSLADGVTDTSDVPMLATGGLREGDWIALRVDGDSMDRISPPGSIILVNRADRKLVPNACYVIANDQFEVTYKRYRPSPARFEPVSVNPDHQTLFPDHLPKIIGRVRRTILDM